MKWFVWSVGRFDMHVAWLVDHPHVGRLVGPHVNWSVGWFDMSVGRSVEQEVNFLYSFRENVFERWGGYCPLDFFSGVGGGGY